MAMVAPRPRAERRWRTSLRAGALWTSLGLALAAVAHELSPAAVAAQLVALGTPRLPDEATLTAITLLPILPLIHGLAWFLRALRDRAHGRVARGVARQLRQALPAEFTVARQYLPRDTGDGDVDIVVVGPTGVFVVEVRDEPGSIACYQDVWYRHDRGMSRFPDSPSRLARWQAARVRGDVSVSGFIRTPVEAAVLFRRGRLIDVASSCVPVFQSVEQLAARMIRPAGPTLSAQRVEAIVRALGLSNPLRTAEPRRPMVPRPATKDPL